MDTGLTAGDIRFEVSSLGGEYSEVAFDNLRVYPPGQAPAQPGPTATPAPPTPTVGPTPRPNGALLFADDFSSAAGGAQALFGSEYMTFAYTGGEGRLSTTYREGVLPAMCGAPRVVDFLADFDFRAESAPADSGYGLVFRSDDAAGGLAWYYQMLIRPADGVAELGFWRGGDWEVEREHELPAGMVTRTGSNHVRLEVVRSEFRVFVNGVFAFDDSDTTLATPGIIGLSAVSGTTQADTVYFDNLRIYSP